METKTKISRWALAVIWCAVVGVGVAIIAAPAASDPPAETIAAPVALERDVPTVTVIDTTGGRWIGLADAVAAWDRSPHVDMVISPVSVEGTYNVYVDAWPMRAKWLGMTQYLDMGTAHITLNTDKAHDEFHDAWHMTHTAAHELAHVLGVVHPEKTPGEKSPRGVIAYTSTNGDGWTELPSGADHALVRDAARSADHAGVFQWQRMGN